MYNFVRCSKNSKTGYLPQTYSPKETCPSSCSFKDNGCYAQNGNVGLHWRKHSTKSWEHILDEIKNLPKGQLWRHNIAGDLAGRDLKIDAKKLDQLIEANKGRKGFTYTHKPVGGKYKRNADLIAKANRSGFTINLSADNLKEADKKYSLGIGPVCVVLPKDAPNKLKTPQGRTIIVCPAQVQDITCEKCKLCSIADRKSIIGFRAHGINKNKVSLIVVK